MYVLTYRCPLVPCQGLALAPWNVLGAGRLRSDEEEERREKSGEKGRQLFGPEWKRTPEEVKLSRALDKVAKEIGAKSIPAGAYSASCH